MIITLSDKIYIDIDGCSSYLHRLVKKYTYDNPEYYSKQNMGFSNRKEKPIIEHFAIMMKNNKKFLVLPRGSIQKCIDTIKEINPAEVIRIDDKRSKGYEIDVDLHPDTILESQQEQIIDILDKNKGGLIEMEPGGGKSISALGFIVKKKVSTLILVHEHRLRTQWEEEIKKRLVGNFKFGRYDGDKKIEGDICIGLIQTVSRLVKEDPLFLSKFGMVICDETHHVPADMYIKVINNVPSFYKIGLTGTVTRKDGKHFLLFDSIGPLLISIKPEHIKHRVTNFKFEMINTDVMFSAPSVRRWANGSQKITVDYTKLLTMLVQNKERNELIINKIEDSLKDQRVTLVISTRVEHCKLIHEELKNRGYNIILLIGETRKETDWSMIRQDTTIQCIVAQDSIASEGLDFPILSALHLTCPSSNNPKLKQKIGRIRRVHPDKPFPMVYDYTDNNVYFGDLSNKPLLRSAQLRKRFYQQLNAEYDRKLD